MNKKLTGRHCLSLLSVLMGFTMLTSCDHDNKLAFKLDREWRGDFGMYYTYTYRGRTSTFNCYDTRIKFNSDIMYSAHGTGVQVDYYKDGPYEYIYYNFDWEINDGVISLWYRWAKEWNTTIKDYSLTLWHFTGYFGNSNQKFELYPLSDYSWNISNTYYLAHGYGWDVYSGYSDYSTDYSDYYFYTRSDGEAKPDSVLMRDSTHATPAPEIMQFGNRFLK